MPPHDYLSGPPSTLNLPAEFFAHLQPSGDYLEKIHDRMWLMDDHKWACWVWEQHHVNVKEQHRYSLLHLDYHFDGVNDFYDDPESLTALRNESIDQLKVRIAAEDRIQFDSFIAPAIIRGVIGNIHFYCLQTSEETDIGIDDETLQQCGVTQNFYDSVEALAKAKIECPYVFDLCLDLFNCENKKMFEGNLWSEAKIRQTLTILRDHIINAECITVSLSFGYSGNEDQTRYLAQLVIPEILEMLKAPAKN